MVPAVHQFHRPLLPASGEQTLIIEAAADNNVIVDAVAGSGKTTTVLHIASKYWDKSILLLTYNARLKQETRDRAVAHGLDNLEVHSYHSFCVKYVHKSCHKDQAIAERIYTDTGLRRDIPVPYYHTVIIDEAQDMKQLFHSIAKIAMAANNPRIVVMGDRCQFLYEYAGADRRYITLADHLYPSPHPWVRLALTVSYRVTRPIAAFVNRMTAGAAPAIVAAKDGPVPRYMYCDDRQLAVEIVKSATADPGSVFILAKSVRVRPNHKLRKIVRELVKRGIPVHIPADDDTQPDARVLDGKVVFSSFHQAKGLERRHVYVAGFDGTHMEDDADVASCPNVLYVACTRATETLTVWHDNSTPGRVPPLAFLGAGLLDGVCEYWPHRPDTRRVQYVEWSSWPAVTDLIRHMQEGYMHEIMQSVRLTTIRPADPEHAIRIESVTRQKMANGRVIYEEVSDISGTAIGAAHEIHRDGVCSAHNVLKAADREYTADMPIIERPGDILRMAVHYFTYLTRLIHKQHQITQFDWISSAQMTECVERVDNILRTSEGDRKYEFELAMPGFDPRVKKILPRPGQSAASTQPYVTGRADIMRGNDLYELKATGELSNSHFMQVLIYRYGLNCIGRDGRTFLYNVIHDEFVQIDISHADLLRAMRIINHAANHAVGGKDDETFLRENGNFKTVQETIDQCEKCVGKFGQYPRVVPPRDPLADAIIGPYKLTQQPARGRRHARGAGRKQG